MGANKDAIFHKKNGRVSLTIDAWSSRKYKVYLVVTAHWLDENWTLQAATLSFECYHAPLPGDLACSRLFEAIKEWNFQRNIWAVTSDNAANIIKSTAVLRAILDEESPGLYLDTQ